MRLCVLGGRGEETYNCADEVELVELVVAPSASELVALGLVVRVEHDDDGIVGGAG